MISVMKTGSKSLIVIFLLVVAILALWITRDKPDQGDPRVESNQESEILPSQAKGDGTRGFNYKFDPEESAWQGLEKPANAELLNFEGVSKPVTVIEGDGVPYAKNGSYASIRIPAAEVANDGSIVCLVQGRLDVHDREPDHAIIMRSTDFGKTWKKTVIFNDNDTTDFGDNSLVVDRTNGRLFAFIYTKEAIMLYTSDDHGVSWQREPDVTRDKASVRMRGTTGIQIVDGHRNPMILPGITGKGHLAYLACEAGKKKWSVLAVHESGEYNEPTVVELKDGNTESITLLNVSRVAGKSKDRDYKYASVYKLNKMQDFPTGKGKWTLKPSLQLTKQNCNQHFKRYSGINDGKRSVILYSSPTIMKRFGGTVAMSLDEGETWHSRQIIPNDIHFAYTSQVILPDGSIGIFYETHNDKGKKVRHGAIKFIRYTLDWLQEKGE